METVFSPSHFRAISNHPKLSLFRGQAKLSYPSNQKICKSSSKFAVYCCKSSLPIIENGVLRRDIVLFGVAATVATMFPIEGSGADEDTKMAPIVDELNAYSYLIPLEFQ